jgi:tetratricopeptide (TPR) repeat protein
MSAGYINTTTLIDRVSILLDELELAIKWDRPCILLAVYQSEFVKEDVQSILRKSLERSGSKVLMYLVDKKHSDVALDLRHHLERKKVIFFISGLRWGGGRGHNYAYHALNMHREYFVEEKLRSVFWLSKNEAKLLPRHAPDFWAFRFSVTEFLDYPAKVDGKIINSMGTDHQKGIERIQATLARDPSNLDLQKKTAYLYDKLGFFEDALAHYYRVLRISPNDVNTWRDIAEIHHKMGNFVHSARILRKVTRLSENKLVH